MKIYCEDRARLVADKLANGKEPKEARRGCAMFAMAIKSWGAGLVLAGEHRDVHVLASPNLKHQPRGIHGLLGGDGGAL